MKTHIVGALALAFLATHPAAFAKDPKDVKTIPVQPLPEPEAMGAALAVRGTAGLGLYDGHTITPAGEGSDGSPVWALGAGSTFTMGRWFGDLALDYYDISLDMDDASKFKRTDITLSGGARILDWLSAFGGLRQGWQGHSGIFKDDVWTETGFFVGGGVAFPVGQGDLRGGASLAYNLSKVSFDSSSGFSDLDYNGLSGKLRVSLARTPHAVELRFQNFKGDDGGTHLCETYAFLVYVFNWQVLNF